VRTGKALREALLSLLERKQFDQITVRDIAAEAGVGYATFFRHHATKESLLDAVASDEIVRLVSFTMPVMDAVSSEAAFGALCGYVESHRALWVTLLTGGAASAMREEWMRVSNEVAAERASSDIPIPVELAVSLTTGMIIETLVWWLRQPPDSVPSETVAALLFRLCDAMAPHTLTMARTNGPRRRN